MECHLWERNEDDQRTHQMISGRLWIYYDIASVYILSFRYLQATRKYEHKMTSKKSTHLQLTPRKSDGFLTRETGSHWIKPSNYRRFGFLVQEKKYPNATWNNKRRKFRKHHRSISQGRERPALSEERRKKAARKEGINRVKKKSISISIHTPPILRCPQKICR